MQQDQQQPVRPTPSPRSPLASVPTETKDHRGQSSGSSGPYAVGPIDLEHEFSETSTKTSTTAKFNIPNRASSIADSSSSSSSEASKQSDNSIRNNSSSLIAIVCSNSSGGGAAGSAKTDLNATSSFAKISKEKLQRINSSLLSKDPGWRRPTHRLPSMTRQQKQKSLLKLSISESRLTTKTDEMEKSGNSSSNSSKNFNNKSSSNSSNRKKSLILNFFENLTGRSPLLECKQSAVTVVAPLDDELNLRTESSNTSISSQGSLKEYIKETNERLPPHQAPIKFKPSAALTKEAIEVSESLAKMHFPSLTSVRNRSKSKSKSKLAKHRDRGPICPLDSTGGYRLTSLDHIKMIKVNVNADDEDDDNEDDDSTGASKSFKQNMEKSIRSNQVTTKSGGGGAGGVQRKSRSRSDKHKKYPKTLPNEFCLKSTMANNAKSPEPNNR